ncbi:peptidylprolyl isomerase [candidate division CSSED10-310 bacterium]|uniref:Peptidylprolyl isomerase n=1 Tax=candidate division CSSED10-310 bacterium TaxID=2855610 RepID=A0ABV6Z0E5_UNCC1
MREKILLICMSLILSSLIFSNYGEIEATQMDKVLAVVNDEIITLSELEERKQRLIAEMSRMVNPDDLQLRIDQVESQALQMMIEEILISQKAEELGVNIDQAAIDDALQNVVNSNNLENISALEVALKNEGMSLEEYKKVIERQLKIFRVQSYEVKSKVRIIEDELKAFYDEHLEEFKNAVRFHIRHILIAEDNTSVEASARGKADMIYEQLRAGEDFCQLAARYSDDPTGSSCGDLGTLEENLVLPEFLEILKPMSAGAFSQPFKSKFGYHIVQLVSREGDNAIPFEEMKDKIKEQLFQEKFHLKRLEWIQELKKASYIKIIGQNKQPTPNPEP